jgi:hypothetical protein
MTGVGLFEGTSLSSRDFSLDCLTFKSGFADLCGFNSAELDELLDERLADMLAALTEKGVLGPDCGRKELRDMVLDWHGGYSWDGKTKVLNFWSVLSFFSERDFGCFWHETETPSFLTELSAADKKEIRLHLESPYLFGLDLESILRGNHASSICYFNFYIGDMAEIDPHIGLFQTGYLTIAEEVESSFGHSVSVRLRPPNLEAKVALIPLLFSVEPPERVWISKELCLAAFDALIERGQPAFQTVIVRYIRQYPYLRHEDDKTYLRSLFLAGLTLEDIPYKAENFADDDGRIIVCVIHETATPSPSKPDKPPKTRSRRLNRMESPPTILPSTGKTFGTITP